MGSDLPLIQWSSILARIPGKTYAVIGTRERLDTFLEARPNDDVMVRVVSGAKCATDEALFEEWSKALECPEYFGKNWNAFIECVTECDWLPGSSLVVVTIGLRALLPDQERFKSLLEVLEFAASRKRWGSLAFIFHAEDYETARAKFSQTNIDVPFYQLP